MADWQQGQSQEKGPPIHTNHLLAATIMAAAGTLAMFCPSQTFSSATGIDYPAQRLSFAVRHPADCHKSSAENMGVCCVLQAGML